MNKKGNDENVRYRAIRMVCIFDKFIEDCAETVDDDDYANFFLDLSSTALEQPIKHFMNLPHMVRIVGVQVVPSEDDLNLKINVQNHLMESCFSEIQPRQQGYDNISCTILTTKSRKEPHFQKYTLN